VEGVGEGGMKNTGKIRKAYEYFCACEKEQRSFTLNEIVEKTGWAISTVTGYRTKKWHQFILDFENGLLICKGLLRLPFENFVKLHEQRTILSAEDYRPHYGYVIDTYLDKSREAALLAIQIYNNPTLSFRTEGFIVYMIISYTALFHAIFEREKIEYWYFDTETGNPKKIDGDKMYWELSRCLDEYYKDQQTAERANLKFCISLRNKIEHRFYDTIDLNLSGYCQSLLLNYESLLTIEFGEYFSLGGSHLSLALQLSSYDDIQNKVLSNIQAKHYKEIQQYINDYCQQQSVEILNSERYHFSAYLVPKIGNHATSSDISIEFVKFDPSHPEEMEKYQKMVGFIKEKTVPVVNQGMHLPGDVVRIINEKGFKFNIPLHTKAWKLFNIRKSGRSPVGCNNLYCQFSAPHKDSSHAFLYTDAWVELLLEKLQNPIEFQKIKDFRDENYPPKRQT
jgi:hypothetical protein